MSPPGASAYWGPLYFQSLVRLAAEDEPGAGFTAILDCADRAGDVLAALRQGLTDLVFHGSGEVRDKLAAISVAKGARLLPPTDVDIDLGSVRDPVASCREMFAAKQR